MSSNEPDGNGADAVLPPPPPPPPIPPNVVPIQAELEQAPEIVKKKVVRVPIARRGLASKGQKISLLTNHFKVNVTNIEGHFFHYSVRSFLYNCPLIFISIFCFSGFIFSVFALNLNDFYASGRLIMIMFIFKHHSQFVGCTCI